MTTTRTGDLAIGFRRGWSDWQKDTDGVVAWAVANGFGAIDLGTDAPETAPAALDAGLRVGSVDLPDWGKLISADAGTRKAAVAAATTFLETCGKLGPMNYFVVILPENPELPRDENFGYAVESFKALAPVVEGVDGKIVIEGWPGPGALCCTPETYRAFFAEVGSSAMGVNFDPSHLIRMGIDPIRFVREFADRVCHVHGKDTELNTENLYEYGHEQDPTFGKPPGFGNMVWRYTIPGHGQMRWTEAFRILAEAGYAGCVCIELEDGNFNGSEEGEKLGLVKGREYLESC